MDTNCIVHRRCGTEKTIDKIKVFHHAPYTLHQMLVAINVRRRMCSMGKCESINMLLKNNQRRSK